MPNKIILKKSSVASKVPQLIDLDFGELALNYADGKLYFKTAANTIEAFSLGGGGGGGGAVDVAFKTIAVPGQLGVVADLPADTLTLVGGPGIEITTDPDSDTITFTQNLLAEDPSGTYTLTGNLVVSGDTTIQGTLYETSDKNLKKNVVQIENPIELVKQLRGVRFDWIKNDKPSVGLIAQEVEQVIPCVVQEDPTGTKTINYTALIGLLVESVKELENKVERLEAEKAKKPFWSKLFGKSE